MATKQVVVITGPAGCGKSVAAKALEDCGFFVVDNFPPQLFSKMIDLADQAGKSVSKVGFVIDAREPSFLTQFQENWHQLHDGKRECSLIYLDANEDTIITRYKETRRKHPLDQGSGIKASIELEKRVLAPLADLATHRLSTDGLSVHKLRHEIKKRFSHDGGVMKVTIMSFGFKYGIPTELDMCFDVRFLDNPYFIDELRELTGLEEKVSSYVLALDHAQEFITRVVSLINYLVPLYQAEGKSYLTIAIGCTGGKHRAPALTEKIAAELAVQSNAQVACDHRDVGRINQ